MMKVLSSIEATPAKYTLPKELSILVKDICSDLPTHALAVYSRQSSINPNLTQRVTIYPTHNIVMASYCANLPMLPKQQDHQGKLDENGRMKVPVQPLCIPSPETFSQLSAYLYTKNAHLLISTLLPTGITTPISLLEHECLQSELDIFCSRLRATYTPYVLINHGMIINGLWRNVVALGIFDDQLWDILDLAWAAIIGALEEKSVSDAASQGSPSPDATPEPVDAGM